LNACYGIVSTHPNVCSSHGQCTGPNNCTCNAGFIGQQCQTEETKCPPGYQPETVGDTFKCVPKPGKEALIERLRFHLKKQIFISHKLQSELKTLKCKGRRNKKNRRIIRKIKQNLTLKTGMIEELAKKYENK
jgi:hypothetical protein